VESGTAHDFLLTRADLDSLFGDARRIYRYDPRLICLEVGACLRAILICLEVGACLRAILICLEVGACLRAILICLEVGACLRAIQDAVQDVVIPTSFGF